LNVVNLLLVQGLWVEANVKCKCKWFEKVLLNRDDARDDKQCPCQAFPNKEL